MKLNYFVHNGIKYYSGSKIKILEYPYNNPGYSRPALFSHYDQDNNLYVYKMIHTGKTFLESEKSFMQKFGGVITPSDGSIQAPQEKQLKDHKIPKLFIGWIWYIVIMAILLICNGFLVGWAITSILFFSWRKNVIKEEGHYVERQI